MLLELQAGGMAGSACGVTRMARRRLQASSSSASSSSCGVMTLGVAQTSSGGMGSSSSRRRSRRRQKGTGVKKGREMQTLASGNTSSSNRGSSRRTMRTVAVRQGRGQRRKRERRTQRQKKRRRRKCSWSLLTLICQGEMWVLHHAAAGCQLPRQHMHRTVGVRTVFVLTRGAMQLLRMLGCTPLCA